MKTLQELQEIRERMKNCLCNRAICDGVVPDADVRAHILVCGGTGCTSGNSKKIVEELKAALIETGLDKEVKLIMTGCFGLCAKGPIVVVYPEGSFYQHVKPEDAREIVFEHIKGGKPVERLLHSEKDADGAYKAINETSFYKSQKRVVLRNCGLIDPENIDEYLARDGYKAYEKVLTTMSQLEVIDEIKRRSEELV